MNFELNDLQKEMVETARKFAQKEMIPLAAKYDEEQIFPKEIFQKAWELGLINTCIPEEFGGNGFSSLDSVLISEELAYGCAGMNTSFMANDLALLPIALGASKEQKEKFLRPFTEEFRIASFCLTEPGQGSDAAGLKTRIEDKGDHYLLNGQKMWITNAGHADLMVVYATINPELKHKGICALIVDPKSQGVEVGKKEDKMGHRASDTRSISFENVKIPKENLIGKEGEGWEIAMKTLDHSRPLVASSAIGVARRALDESLKYAQERKQFGAPIIKNQAISFMLAEMAIKLESSKLLTYKAARQCDLGQRNTITASMAKAMSADSAMQICTDAVQIFGGYGYSKEYPVEKLMRDAKLIQIYEGTSQIQRLVISRELIRG